MRVPDDDEIRALHQRHAPTPEAFDLVHTHCRIIWDVAAQLIARSALDVDADLVRAGCLLHDVGVYRLYDAEGRPDFGQYIRHGVLGHDLLREEGYPDALCRFCSHHTGVGLTRDDVLAQNLPLPVADYLAETPEEELVMYADKFHSKSTPPVFLTADTYAARIARFGPSKTESFKRMRQALGTPDLPPLAATYGYTLT
ncbi:HD domain-containing protein [Actinomadura rubteroloni]|nr:HD domain-containing protein [Actinomadura rubteroloni]